MEIKARDIQINLTLDAAALLESILREYTNRIWEGSHKFESFEHVIDTYHLADDLQKLIQASVEKERRLSQGQHGTQVETD